VDSTRAPGRRYRRRRLHLLATGVIYITFLPAYAVLSALIYYRLTAARAAAGLS